MQKPFFKIPFGFTLLELLAVLAIVGLLVGIAYPTYTQHVLTARRASAEVALLNLASSLEQYYASNHTYAGVTFAALQVSEYVGESYRLVIEGASANSYLLKAIPQGSQMADKVCGTLSIDSFGEKRAGSTSGCW